MIEYFKYHGLGNDYIYIDSRATGLEQWSDTELAELARLVSDRQFGIGGDGMILIEGAGTEGAGMRIFNADGSEAEMCGNGIRCVARHLFDHGHIGRAARLTTKAGPIGTEVRELDKAGRAATIRVDMGPPRLEPEQIPARLPTRKTIVAGVPLEAVLMAPLLVDGRVFEVTCVSMGNPHCVIFTHDIALLDLPTIGPSIERHAVFPARANVEFVEQTGPSVLRQRTWERGSGETLACGTGASAVVVAAILNGKVETSATVHLPGGPLEIEWTPGGSVFMTGPASYVGRGEFSPEDLRAARRPGTR